MKYLREFKTREEYDSFQERTVSFPNVCLVAEDVQVEYNKIPANELPLYIEAVEDVAISFGNTYEYSKDKKTWHSGASDTVINATAGEAVFFRATGLTPNSSTGIGSFTLSGGKCNVGGNVMSLVSAEDFVSQNAVQNYQFYNLFNGCSTIVRSRDLCMPATTLAKDCYYAMFRDCTSLTYAPELPATELAYRCYGPMFYKCTSLTNAPALPATTLAIECYAAMFAYCKSLVSAPALPATTLAGSCYNQMFYECTNLVNAPELPATTLKSSCYGNMFFGCKKLAYIKAMFVDTPGTGYTYDWVRNVASNGTFVKNSAATWDVTGRHGIPSGWTIEYATS